MKRAVAVLALSAVALLGLTGCAPKYDGDTTDCTVTEKDTREIAALTKSAPRVFTSCGVFHIEDDAFAGQWNSADTYQSVEVGKTYDFEAVGYRNGFFSLFPNIITAEEVTQ